MKSRAFQHTQKFTESPQSLVPLNSDFCPVKRLLNQDPAIWQFGFVKSLVHFLQGVGIETRRSTCHPNVGRDRKTLAVEPGSGCLQSGLFLYKEIYCGETRCSETQTGFNHAPVESCSGNNFCGLSANRTARSHDIYSRLLALARLYSTFRSSTARMKMTIRVIDAAIVLPFNQHGYPYFDSFPNSQSAKTKYSNDSESAGGG